MNNLTRSSIDNYKEILKEGLGYQIGRLVGRGRNAARSAGRAIGNIPGVKPVVRTAAVAAGVAGGVYAYDKILKPETPQINVPVENTPRNRSYVPQSVSDATSQPAKKKNRGSYNTIVPVRQPKSSDYAKYAADVRSPGGAVGAERRRQADRVLAKWQAEDQAVGLPSRPSFEDELKKSKENTAKLEAQLRAEDEAKVAQPSTQPAEKPKIYLGRKPGMLKK